MGYYGSNLSNGRSPCVLQAPATNWESSNVLANRLVSRYTGSAASSMSERGDQNALGVIVPSATNWRVFGVLAGNGNANPLETNQNAGVIVGGRTRLLVRVPASLNLPAGTGLVPATAFEGTTNDVVVFGGDASGTNPGCAEAVVKNGVIYEPANPIAWLAAPLTATSGVTYQLAEVVVDYNHKPQFVHHRITIATPADLTLHALVPFGPGVLHSIACSAADFTGTGNFVATLNQCPLGTTADVESMLTTAPAINSTGTPSNGAVTLTDAGGTTALCGSDGDTDTGVSIGTSGSNGVIAPTKRLFTDKSILNLVISGTPASMTNASVDIGFWYI